MFYQIKLVKHEFNYQDSINPFKAKGILVIANKEYISMLEQETFI